MRIGIRAVVEWCDVLGNRQLLGCQLISHNGAINPK